MTPADLRVANAPCSWGVLEFEGMSGEATGYDIVLDEMRETGYIGTELGDWGFMPTDPAALRAELDRRQLALVGAFVPVAFKDETAHAAGEAHALQVARLLAATAELSDGEERPVIVLADENGVDPVRSLHAGRTTPEMGLSDDDWHTFARGVERVARAVDAATGLRAVFHPHAAGYVETPEEMIRLLALTDPAVVGLAFDTGHLTYGMGATPATSLRALLDQVGDRIGLVHFKDCDPNVATRARREGWDYFTAVRHGVFCELGQGAVDFSEVVTWLRGHDYAGWIVVEQDVLPGLGTPFESARRNWAYLATLGV